MPSFSSADFPLGFFLKNADGMIGKSRVRHFNTDSIRLSHQSTCKHINLRGAACIDILKRGKAGIRPDTAMLVLFILYGDSVGSCHADCLIKKLIMDKAHMRTVDIGLKPDIQNRLREIKFQAYSSLNILQISFVLTDSGSVVRLAVAVVAEVVVA